MITNHYLLETLAAQTQTERLSEAATERLLSRAFSIVKGARKSNEVSASKPVAFARA